MIEGCFSCQNRLSDKMIFTPGRTLEDALPIVQKLLAILGKSSLQHHQLQNAAHMITGTPAVQPGHLAQKIVRITEQLMNRPNLGVAQVIDFTVCLHRLYERFHPIFLHQQHARHQLDEIDKLDVVSDRIQIDQIAIPSLRQQKLWLATSRCANVPLSIAIYISGISGSLWADCSSC